MNFFKKEQLLPKDLASAAFKVEPEKINGEIAKIIRDQPEQRYAMPQMGLQGQLGMLQQLQPQLQPAWPPPQLPPAQTSPWAINLGSILGGNLS